MAGSPRVFTLPPSVPFLPTLVQALIEGRLIPGFAPAADPLALASVTLYLPTRRACRRAHEVFLDVLGTEAVLLPRIVPIGDIDEDAFAFAEGATAEAFDLPDALGGFERRMLLARLVLHWAKQLRPHQAGEATLVVANPAAAFALADELAHLMDDMATREVKWERLDALVPEEVDRYWQLTLDFLKIAREHWPKILAARNKIEPAERRDRLIAAEAERLASGADGPVIAAGSTGSMPATAKLLATIARLPRGAVVLPGLDTDLDEESWTLISGGTDGVADGAPAFGHPQFAMHALLRRMGLSRADIIPLAQPAPHGREVVISEALRPAGATERWQERLADATFAKCVADAFADLAVIEAANAEEEALAIAVALREATEEADKTAALVTPDRALARRVLAALGRWEVDVDDSGGDALAATPAGIFARLAAEVALGGLAPVGLLALLKHPLLRLGAPAGAHGHAIAALERAILRGPRPRPGSAALAHALATVCEQLAKLRAGERSEIHPSDPRASLTEIELAAASELLKRVTAALAPLERLAAEEAHPFNALAARHREVITALGTDEAGQCAVLAGPAGIALAEAFDTITAEASADLPIAPADYGALFAAAISDRIVRRPAAAGARVRILGPLEARLTEADRVVLGGLVEGIWPPEPRPDPWLNRPMRQALGLDLPERRIGLSAHDFAQLLGAREVILTRAIKVAGAPAVASRFLQRLAAVAGEDQWQQALARGGRYLALARHLDRPHAVRPIAPPQPRPPRALRPTRLSVTEIEHWLRDPYTIYAKHILKLTPLDPVDMRLTAADRGSAIHNAIGEFVQRFAERLPADPYGELLRIGRTHFEALEDHPEARALWWPRFERIARWFVAWEAERRANISDLRAEIRGEIEIPLGARKFVLSARADRIERLAHGGYAILDFKTGAVPSDKQVRIGVAPQLILEAAILHRGGFPQLPAEPVRELVYVKLKGGHPAGEPRVVKLDVSADEAAKDAYAKLEALVRKFEDETTPYRAQVLPMWKNRYGAYDNLARVKEWSASAGAEGGEE